MKKENTAGIHPNVGLSAAYQKKLDDMIEQMQKSLVYWIKAAYNAKPPATLAQDGKYDGSPVVVMNRTMKRLAKLWQKRFDEAAPKLAAYFSQAFADRTDKQLKSILRKGGFSVKFQTSPAIRDVINSEISQNIGLITNIAQKHIAAIEGSVMRSIAAGRDIGTLVTELEKELGITKRRAKLIAHHQNQLATASIQRERYKELGIEEAIWCHSAGGKEPRPAHVRAGKEKLRYNPQEGAYIDGEYILPGQLINCRCFARPVLRGMKV